MANVGSLMTFDDKPPMDGEDVSKTKMLEPRSGPEPFATGKPEYSQEIMKDRSVGALGIRGHCEEGK